MLGNAQAMEIKLIQLAPTAAVAGHQDKWAFRIIARSSAVGMAIVGGIMQDMQHKTLFLDASDESIFLL